MSRHPPPLVCIIQPVNRRLNWIEANAYWPVAVREKAIIHFASAVGNPSQWWFTVTPDPPTSSSRGVLLWWWPLLKQEGITSHAVRLNPMGTTECKPAWAGTCVYHCVDISLCTVCLGEQVQNHNWSDVFLGHMGEVVCACEWVSVTARVRVPQVAHYSMIIVWL